MVRRIVPLLLVLVLDIGDARALTLEEIFGTYVGRAVVETLPSGERETRDIDITVAPHGRGGFQISWINVTLVDGRRDVPGVKRHRGEVMFQKAPNGSFFVEVTGYNPFREREEIAPMSGDPVRWAVLDEGGLHVYSFVVLEDGRYELQRTTRAPVPGGLALTFERVDDDTLVRAGEGRAVRVEE
jgi:hypothetical protein